MSVRRKWPWLLLLLITGFCSAVVVPNLLTAMDRSRQKKTMASMRDWGLALELFAEKHPGAVAGKAAPSLEKAMGERRAALPPLNDGWGHRLIVGMTERGYFVRSLGRDGEPQQLIAEGPTTNFDCDIVFADGTFIQFPEGI